MNALSVSRRVALVTFIGGLGGGLVFPILPALGLHLGISGFMIGLILSANRISRLACDPFAGVAVEWLGGRFALTAALLVETIGVLCYSGALHFGHPAWWLLGGRAIYGVGSALLLVGAQAMVLARTTVEDRGRRLASVRVALGSGMPAGLILGGVIADMFSDDVAFLTGAGLTLIGAAVAGLLLPSSRGGSPETRRSKGGGAVFDLLRSPQFRFVAAAWGFNLLVFLIMQGVLLATMVVMVEERGVHVFGMGPQGTAGIIMAVLMACSSVMAFVIGGVLDRLALRSGLVVPALAGLAAGFTVLAFADSLWLILAGAVLVGLSYNGITLPMLALLGDATTRNHGRAVGLYQVFGDIGGSLGPIIGLQAALDIGLLPLYLAMAVLPLAAEAAAFWLLRSERALCRDGGRSGSRRRPRSLPEGDA